MYLTIAVKLIVGMIGVLIFLRISGKAQMAMLTPLDSVNAFVLGALVGGVIYNPDMDAWHMVFALFIWTSFNMLIRYCLKFRFFRKLVKGDAVYIVKGGILNLHILRRNFLEMEQFRTLLREKGVFSLFDIDDARFETNGQITVSTKGDNSESYLFINNGYILQSSLSHANRTEGWLLLCLKHLGYEEPKDLFCVEWTPKKGFYIVNNEGKIKYKNQTYRYDRNTPVSA